MENQTLKGKQVVSLVKRFSNKFFQCLRSSPPASTRSLQLSFVIIWKLNIEQKQKAGIVTSLNDTTLTKVTYGKHATRVPDEVAYGIYELFSSK